MVTASSSQTEQTHPSVYSQYTRQPEPGRLYPAPIHPHLAPPPRRANGSLR